MSAEHTVLVGVDGSEASHAAVRYAATRVVREGGVLRLVHVRPDYLALAPMMPIAPIDLEPSSREILAAAVQVALTILPDAQVHRSIADGPRVPALVAASREADLVVLGDQRHHTLQRLLTGSTVFGVGAVAACPVVAVPVAWTADQPERHRVVVGVRTADQAPDLVRRALELAEPRGARVVVVHAWELPGEYDDLISRRIDERATGDRARAELTAAIAEVAAGHPGVPTEVWVVHGQPARVLAEVSVRADLLLLARRRHVLLPHHLGGTARAVVWASECPVMVYPPAEPRADEPGARAAAEPAHA